MKTMHVLWTVVVNIFLVLLVSVVMEYSDLNSRFKELENAVSTAVDTALVSATASEEFFSSKYNAKMSSYATDSAKRNIFGGVRVYNKVTNAWVTGEVYKMAYFYDTKGRFPNGQAEYGTVTDSLTTQDIYEWLFGKAGTVYMSYPWANKKTKLWDASKWSGYFASRAPKSNFKAFYDHVGYNMKSTAYVKVPSGSSYRVETKEIPTLTQMGLELDPTYNGGTGGGALMVNDYLCSTVHFGKAASGIADTQYFLTPYSLGVTYVPVEVFKPMFIAHMDQIVRFGSIRSTVTNDGNVEDFASSTGCISTEVYAGGGSSSAAHTGTTGDYIVNDGAIEYDLSTAQVKVDYFYVDFYDNANWRIVNRIEGSTSQVDAAGNKNVSSSNDLTTLPQRLKAKDTSYDKRGGRIVAKVTAKIKVHIPYKSGVLQWFRQLNDTDGVNHYDIRLWDEVADGVSFDSDGVWYEYSTYTAISR